MVNLCHRIKFIESLTVADVDALKPNSGTLTVFTTEKGTISDDLIVTKTDSDHLYVVTNAGRRTQDVALMKAKAQEMR